MPSITWADLAPHKSNYYRELEQNRERNRKLREDPEYRKRENAKKRDRNREYMREYRKRNQRGPEGEIIDHSPDWLRQEAQDVVDYPAVKSLAPTECRLPSCENVVKAAGLCWSHHRDPAVRAEHGERYQAQWELNPDYWRLFCQRARERSEWLSR